MGKEKIERMRGRKRGRMRIKLDYYHGWKVRRGTNE
jgi:hypothetical protein